MRLDLRLIGFAAATASEAVSILDLGLSIRRPLVHVGPGSSFHALALLQSTFVRTPAPRLSTKSTPTRVPSLIAASPMSVHFTRGLPRPRYVPPSGFLSLSTACSAPRLRGLVPSRSHVQGSSRSGASPSVQPPSLSRGVCPPAVETPNTRHPRTAAISGLSRLRGLYPHEDALRRFGVTRPFARSPRRVRSSSRSSVSSCAPVPRPNPLMRFFGSTFGHECPLVSPLPFSVFPTKPPVDHRLRADQPARGLQPLRWLPN
jgi:hypothetical protein